MKKNLWFKLGLFSTALVLVATCFISTAWAKYTKDTSLTSDARVALFKVNYDDNKTAFTTTLNLFSTSLNHIYKTGDNNVGSDSKNLIAPGSHGSQTIKVQNNGEVDVQISLAKTAANQENGIPLVFVITTAATDEGKNYTSLDNAIVAFNTENLVVNNSSSESGKEANVNIFWKWEYETTGNASDNSDTVLGEDGSKTYNLALTLTATQVQPE